MSLLMRIIVAETEYQIRRHETLLAKRNIAIKGDATWIDTERELDWTFGALLSLQKILMKVGSPKATALSEQINQTLNDEEKAA